MMPPSRPEMEEVHREIAVWNPAKQLWERGRRTDFFVPAPLDILLWLRVLPGTNVPPDFDLPLEILYAQRLTIQGDSTHHLNASGDVDLNLETSIDGAVWDTVPYAQRNWARGEVKTFLVEVGPSYVRFRLDNNHPDEVLTDPAEDTVGTVEALVSTHVIDPGGSIRLIRVELDAFVSDGTGQYRITTQRVGEPEVELIPPQTVANTTYMTFSHTVSVDSDEALTVRYYIRHMGDALTNTITSRNYDAVSQYKAAFIARVLHVD